MSQQTEDDRPLPVWLSQWVEPLDCTRRKRQATEAPALGERVQRFLHARHSFASGLKILGWIFVPTVALSCLYGWYFPPNSIAQSSAMSSLAASLGGVAGALANVSAI